MSKKFLKQSKPDAAAANTCAGRITSVKLYKIKPIGTMTHNQL